MKITRTLNSISLKTIRAVIYVRVSSDEQAKREFSIPKIQIPECMAMIRNNGWVYVETFIDEAKDCNTFIKRDSLQRMLNERLHDYDVVVVYSFDRLAGDDQNTAGQIYSTFDRNRKQITSVKQPVQIFDSNEYDPKSLQISQSRQMNNIGVSWDRKIRRERFMDAIIKTVEGGRPVSEAPYGYKLVRQIHPTDNKRTIGYRMINKDEEPILKRIFEERAEGKPIKNTVYDLNNEGIRTRYGNLWSKPRIYQILKNPFPAGLFLRGRARERKFGDDTIIERFPEEQWRRIPINRELEKYYKPIITKELFDKVQEISRINKRNFPKAVGSRNILGGILKCPECGKPMVETSIYKLKKYPYYRSYYGCSENLSKGICNSIKYHSWRIKKDVVQTVIDYINKPEEFNKEFVKNRERLIKDKRDESKKLESRIKKVQTNIKSLNLKFIEEKIKEPYYKKMLIDFEQQERSLSEKIVALQKEISDYIKRKQKLIEIKDFNKYFSQGFSNLNVPEKKQIIRYVVEKVVMDKKTGKWEVILRF